MATILLVACSSNTPATDDTASTPASPAVSAVGGPDAESSAQRFPDIIDAQPTHTGDTWTFAVTVSSPYDTPDRYANGWRILGPDGTVYGEHALDHDHASEQPFTRTQSGVPIPNGVTSITIEGRDLVNGYGGTTLTIDLPT
ncbi:MAG: hypothetical protein ABI894_00645 [Ilumatobacteraceae bacterium]